MHLFDLFFPGNLSATFLRQRNAKIRQAKWSLKTARVLGRAVQEALECRRLLSGYELAALANFDTAVGTNPQGGVIMDAAGNLYGTTQSGGANGAGSVFELAKGASTVALLATFNGTNGQSPYGRLFRDSNGDLFGTAAGGGGDNEGAVFELAKGDSTITTLASFNYDNGESPIGGVILDSLGNIYGTTEQGGASGYGTIFELAKGDSTITTLFSANYADAASPQSELVMDSNGNLYGTSPFGGELESGAVYE